MSAPGIVIQVESGVGFSATTGKATPVVRVTAVGTSPTGGLDMVVTGVLAPRYARRIGLDLIGAASIAIAETGIREYARERGLDGDSIIVAVKKHVQAMLEAEG